jgi:hypothetical protein
MQPPHIAEPCHEDWDAMTGDLRERHCARCELRVVDLSELRRDAAAELLRRDGRRCVRFTRADGRLVTRSDREARLLGLLRVLAERGAP